MHEQTLGKEPTHDQIRGDNFDMNNRVIRGNAHSKQKFKIGNKKMLHSTAVCRAPTIKFNIIHVVFLRKRC